MNYLKSSLTLSALLGVGVGTALLAQAGMGATVERGADVPWFDRSLVGAAGGVSPSVLAPKLCATCDEHRDWIASEASAVGVRHADASGEARLIAGSLESMTVPLLLLSDNRIVQVDLAQIEIAPVHAAMP